MTHNYAKTSKAGCIQVPVTTGFYITAVTYIQYSPYDSDTVSAVIFDK